jgi:hypothetical protein
MNIIWKNIVKIFQSVKWDTLKHAHPWKVIQCDTPKKGWTIVCSHPFCNWKHWCMLIQKVKSLNDQHTKWTFIEGKLNNLFVIILLLKKISMFFLLGRLTFSSLKRKTFKCKRWSNANIFYEQTLWKIYK